MKSITKYQRYDVLSHDLSSLNYVYRLSIFWNKQGWGKYVQERLESNRKINISFKIIIKI